MTWKHQLIVGAAVLGHTTRVQSESFDYVIVGGGTCGLTVANKLSEDPKVTVAVIDPGPDQRQTEIVTNPLIWTNNLGAWTDWSYQSTPQQGGDGRTLRYSAGKGIGGTSLINGMTYIRGDKAQFDAWERLGNPGWNWDTLFRYYNQTERFTSPTQAQVAAGASYDPVNHGVNGPLHVGFPFYLINGTFETSVSKGWQNLSIPTNKDVNSGDTHGFDVWPQTLDRDKNYRWDAATAFYWPVKDRSNLKLINGTAIKAVWATSSPGLQRATGVEYVDAHNKTRTVDARREVIVSAGSLRTPVFLEVSGVGNPKILGKHNIPITVALPAVGENLQDQPNQNLAYMGTVNVTGNAPYAVFNTAQDLFGKQTSTVAASTKHDIPKWASLVAEASGGALNASALESIYKIQHDLIFHKNVTITEALPTGFSTTFIVVFWGLLPFSRGSVHLSSPSTLSSPLIDPKFFLIDHDLDVNIAIGKLCRRFVETASASKLVSGKLSPNDTVLPENATDAQWAAYLRSTFATNTHPIGTAAMMARELGGVVDPQLKVYGTSNLRVVDASVLPTQFSGHLTATLYAVSLRAAELIKAACK